MLQRYSALTVFVTVSCGICPFIVIRNRKTTICQRTNFKGNDWHCLKVMAPLVAVTYADPMTSVIIANIEAVVINSANEDVNFTQICVGFVLRMFNTMKDSFEVSNDANEP